MTSSSLSLSVLTSAKLNGVVKIFFVILLVYPTNISYTTSNLSIITVLSSFKNSYVISSNNLSVLPLKSVSLIVFPFICIYIIFINSFHFLFNTNNLLCVYLLKFLGFFIVGTLFLLLIPILFYMCCSCSY